MARGGSGAFGGKTLLKPYIWLALCLVFLLGLADLRRPLTMRNPTCLRFSPSRSRSRSSTAARSFGASRSSTRCWATCSFEAYGSGRDGAERLTLGLADVGARGRGRLPPRLPDRPQCGHPASCEQRDRRRACGRRGREQDSRRPGSVRAYAPARRSEALRAGGHRRTGSRPHPDERPLRNGDRTGRHVRACLVSRLCARDARFRLEREMGPSACGTCDLHRVRSPSILALVLVGLRFSVPGLQRCSPSPGLPTPSPRTRSTRTRTTRSCPRSSSSASGSCRQRGREVPQSRSAGWTKFAAPRRPVVGAVPELRPPATRALCRSVRRDDRPCVHHPPARARSLASHTYVLRPHARLPDRAGFPVLTLGLGQYHARGIPTWFVQPVLSLGTVVLALLVAVFPRRKGPFSSRR